MALVLNEEQQMLQASARDYLADRAPVSLLRELRDSGNEDGFSREVWSEMAELGWPAILVPEAYGGLDYGYTGLGVLLEESGRTLTASPLLSTALVGAAALAKAGSDDQKQMWLPKVAAGRRFLALACDEEARHEPERIHTEADASGSGFRLNGRKTAVMDGHYADALIVSAWTGDGASLFLVPSDTPGVSVTAYPVLDTHLAANVELDHIELPESSLLGPLDGGQALLDDILDAGRVGASAELLGIAVEAFERTVAYLHERRQFGVPIGSFQALQHRAAILFGEIELSRSVLLKALQALDECQADCAELASLCKAKLGETALLATSEAVQMHGGIGMTDDFDIGLFLKRARVLDTLWGDRHFHLDRFARLRGY